MAGVRIAASGMAWKASESEKVITVAASTIKWAQWLRVARNYQLRIGTIVENKNGSKDQRKEKFDGFQREVGRKTRKKKDS
jgi:structure-specific recognition protein 1